MKWGGFRGIEIRELEWGEGGIVGRRHGGLVIRRMVEGPCFWLLTWTVFEFCLNAVC